MPTVEEYIQATDNANDYADHVMETLEQPAREDMDALYTDPSLRDDELWTELGVPSDLVLSDYDEVPREERDINWSLGLSGISAAALYQFFLDNRDKTILNPTAYRAQVVGPIAAAMTREQLITAGKRGFEVLGTMPFATLKPQYLAPLAPLKGASNTALYNGLTEIGAMRPAEKVITNAMANVARMTGHGPGSPQFKAEIAQLIDSNAKRGLTGMNRRAVEQIYVTRAIGGDINQLMVWIVEGGNKTCNFCLDRAGDVMTDAEWTEVGRPGADVCAGADS